MSAFKAANIQKYEGSFRVLRTMRVGHISKFLLPAVCRMIIGEPLQTGPYCIKSRLGLSHQEKHI